jgi:hypothetical protein
VNEVPTWRQLLVELAIALVLVVASIAGVLLLAHLVLDSDFTW